MSPISRGYFRSFALLTIFTPESSLHEAIENGYIIPVPDSSV
jgi:hypothetical protein